MFGYSGVVVWFLVIGILVGVIFGVGVNVVLFFVYDIGCCWVKLVEWLKWGKGSYEVIVCVEMVNNVNIGGLMLLILVFGIFGNVLVVVLIVVF